MESTKLPNSNSEVQISFYRKLCRKKWFKIVRPIIIFALILLIIYLLTAIGIFRVNNIESNKELDYINNLEQVTNQYKGEGYFSLNLNQLKNDITNSNRYVKSVEARKIFPNKVVVEIEEYQPLSYLEYKDTCYIFSEEGIILEENTEYEECLLEGGIMLKSNQNIIAENRLIFDIEILEVVTILEEFGWIISSISFDQSVLIISDGEKSVTIEINNEYEDQLSKLYLVLEKVNIESIEYKSLDLRFKRPVMELL